MPRSEAQSDFSVVRAPAAELPPTASPVALPDADANLAGELTTRWMMRITLLALAALALLCAIGPHIPSGE